VRHEPFPIEVAQFFYFYEYCLALKISLNNEINNNVAAERDVEIVFFILPF